MRGGPIGWALRVAWAAMPFTIGPALAAALDQRSSSVQVTASVGAWAVWALALVATLVPHPVGLTAVRAVAPAALAASVWAVAAGGPSGAAATLALVWSGAVAVGVLLPEVGLVFVNGPAYPNERRYPLSPPAAVLLGPLELAWAIAVVLPVAAVLTLAARQWILGAALLVVAAPTTWLLGRALHGLSRRWVVLVPAGLVLHDPLTLVDPVLFTREHVAGLGPAPAGSDALDLTAGAAGLALELRLRAAAPLARTARGEPNGRPVETDRLLFTPTRPGSVLHDAARRRLSIGA